MSSEPASESSVPAHSRHTMRVPESEQKGMAGELCSRRDSVEAEADQGPWQKTRGDFNALIRILDLILKVMEVLI